MDSKTTIHSLARLLWDLHGSNAEEVAMDNMLLSIQRDDIKDASMWLDIMNAINELALHKQQRYLH